MTFDVDLAKLTVRLCGIGYFESDRIERDLGEIHIDRMVFTSGRSTQAFTARSETTQFLVFRGTEGIADWLANARFLPTSREQGVHIHTGFIDALDEVWGELAEAVVESNLPVVVTGHSLGGALASLAALRLTMGGSDVEAVYTYGQPRTGHSDFRTLYDDMLGSITFRFINHIDLVTRVPLLAQNYRHVGRRMYFDADGRLHRDATAWQIARDDLSYRLRHLGKISSVGIAPHLLPPYRTLVDQPQT
jgi:predicted lipase